MVYVSYNLTVWKKNTASKQRRKNAPGLASLPFLLCQEQGQTSKPVEFPAFSRQCWRTQLLGPDKYYPVLNEEPSTQTNVVWTTLVVSVLRNTACGQLSCSGCHWEKLSKKKSKTPHTPHILFHASPPQKKPRYHLTAPTHVLQRRPLYFWHRIRIINRLGFVVAFVFLAKLSPVFFISNNRTSLCFLQRRSLKLSTEANTELK